VTVRVNGAPRDLPDGATVADLLGALGLAGRTGVAVAVDRAVVPRSAHATTVLRDGAEVEVIRAVGGG
jgi:sulfur carrier protein